MDFRKLINTLDKLESKKTLTEVAHRNVTKEPGLKESVDYTLKFKKGSIAEALLGEKSQEGDELDALKSTDSNGVNSQFPNAPDSNNTPDSNKPQFHIDPNTFSTGVTAAASSVAPTASSTSTEPGTSYVIKKGDTLWDIAKASGTTVDKLLAANQHIAALRNGGKTMQPGDTLTAPANVILKGKTTQPAATRPSQGRAAATTATAAPVQQQSSGSALVDRTVQAASQDPVRAVQQLNVQWKQAKQVERLKKSPAISSIVLQKAINGLEAKYPDAKKYMDSIRPVKFNIPTSQATQGPFTKG